MKQAVKFTFDTHFGEASARPASRDNAPQGLAEADIEKIRNEAYASGYAAGETDAIARSDREVTHAMSQLAENAASLLTALSAHTASTKKEAAALALEAARKFAPALIATCPTAEIEAVLRDCLTHLNREPHILLRVSSTLVERLKEIVDRMAMERGLSGRIILLGEPSMKEGDCVVEWADGGVVRDLAEIEKEVCEIVSRYIETISAPDKNTETLAMPESRVAGRDRPQ
ncbi:FliH/SctL family protein [Parvibaculum lavamentivorans]|nr:FliH/SctL family protein [Parvibaculum lavamentivorans]